MILNKLVEEYDKINKLDGVERQAIPYAIYSIQIIYFIMLDWLLEPKTILRVFNGSVIKVDFRVI